MAQVLVNGLTDEQRGRLQLMAGMTAAKELRRVSMSGLAREIIVAWLDENCPQEDAEPRAIRIPQEYIDKRSLS